MAFEFNNPLLYELREGSALDPYIPLSTTSVIVSNKIVLSELPNQFEGVTISGYAESKSPSGLIATTFYVNYINGIVSFASSENGKTVTANFKGRGIIQIPAERVYSTDGNDVTQTLQNMINTGSVAIESLGGLTAAISTAQDLETELDSDIATGNVLKSDLDSRFTTADTKKTALDLSISNSNTSKTNLDASIVTSGVSKTALDLSNTNAGITKSNLDLSNTTALATKVSLDGSNTTALGTKTALDLSDTTANSTKNNLDNSISSATIINGTLDGTISTANISIGELNATDATAQANESIRISQEDTRQSQETNRQNTYSSGHINFKGVVTGIASLPASANVLGDTYQVINDAITANNAMWRYNGTIFEKSYVLDLTFAGGYGANDSQVFTATENQTLFTLTEFPYLLNVNQLMVYVTGIKQIIGINYTETSTNSFTLGSGVVAGTKVEAFRSVPGGAGSLTTQEVENARVSSLGIGYANLKARIDAHDFEKVGDLANLPTVEKSDIVSSITEVSNEIAVLNGVGDIVEKANNTIIDAGNIITATTVEGALQEIETKRLSDNADNAKQTYQVVYLKSTDSLDEGQNILDAVALLSEKGKLVLEGTFKLDKPIDIVINGKSIDGYNAIIDCKGTQEISGINGDGGGFVLSGSKNTIKGLTLIGYAKAQLSTSSGYGRLIKVIGNNNLIIDAFFEDGNGGAIELNGDNNKVYGNTMERCNNHPVVGGDYGSVHVRNGVGNKIIDNVITGQFYSGVSAYGSTVKRLTIRDNTIIADKGTANTSMGVFFLQGAGADSKILDNYIDNVTAESICIFAADGVDVSNIKIKGNTCKNFNFAGIAVYKSTANYCKRFTISDNTLIHEDGLSTMQHYLLLEQIKNSKIMSNIIKGFGDTEGTTAVGINLYESPSGNSVIDNSISNVATAIAFGDGGVGSCNNNKISLCATAISYAYCNASSIQDNKIDSCTNGLNGGVNSAYAFVAGNLISNTVNPTKGNIQLYGDIQTSIGATRPYTSGTLVGGFKSVSFFHVKAGDAFMVIPTTTGGTATNSGSLYVEYIDPNSNLVNVRSTNVADVRQFILIKVANGITP